MILWEDVKNIQEYANIHCSHMFLFGTAQLICDKANLMESIRECLGFITISRPSEFHMSGSRRSEFMCRWVWDECILKFQNQKHCVMSQPLPGLQALCCHKNKQCVPVLREHLRAHWNNKVNKCCFDGSKTCMLNKSFPRRVTSCYFFLVHIHRS